MKILFLLILSSWSLVITSCAGIESKQPPPTVESVDLSRYAGTWYEIARLPMWFQRHCRDSKAMYATRSDGKLDVHNECMTTSGHVEQADGIATVIDHTTNARLAVSFDNWFAWLIGPSREGNYWIFDLDSDYHTAMVGTPDHRYLWILSRTQTLDDASYDRLITKAQQLGFPISNLIKSKRPTGS